MKRGRKLSQWTHLFLMLDENSEYSMKDLQTIFKLKYYCIYAKIRGFYVNPVYYKKYKYTKLSYYSGKDLIDAYKRVVASQTKNPENITKNNYKKIKNKKG
ncbi:MAG: hypothetical protein DCC88_00375 [Spirobacillus cienkowskii]|uniref:Uncharacterized protein n=1 Tax=Spirobacillus cienkowskii TaxID=495820 RepID=A0A369L1K9_9BACT|nr:MAG: hypothetical protein DCC88_00375 [Spirobacillus cienkowskii]